MDDIVVYPSKSKLLGIALAALIFAAAGLWTGIQGKEIGLSGLLIFVAAYLGVPFFLGCMVYAIYRVAVPRPSVIINAQGIYDNATLTGAGMIQWEEIAKIIHYQYMGQQFLGIIPADIQAVITRQPFLKRMVMRRSMGMVQAPFNIPQNILPMTAEELLARIRRFRGQD